MKCLNREELFANSYHFLEPREEATARAHLAECAVCRSLLDEYQRLNEALEEWEPVEPSPGFDARLLGAAREGERERALRRSLWHGWLAPACVLLVVVAGSIVTVRTSRKIHPFVQPPAGRGVAVSAPSRSAAPAETVEDELNLYKELPVLENYDLLADFDVLSELHPGGQKVED